MNKKGQSLGLVVGLIAGVASLIVAIIIAFTIVGVLDGSNIIPQTTYTVVNESDLTGDLASANSTGYSVNGTKQAGAGSFIVTEVWAEYYQSNGSATETTSFGGYNVSLDSSNYTLSTSGELKNTTYNYGFPNVSVTYTYVGDNSQNLVAANLTSNFSSGVSNVSSKIPTILLIAAVILILGVLAILIAMRQRMRGGGGSL